jgi:hypothetical protein
MDRSTSGRLAGGPGTEVIEEASGRGALIVQTRGQAGGLGNRPPSAIAYFRRGRVEAGGVAGKAGSRPGVGFGLQIARRIGRRCEPPPPRTPAQPAPASFDRWE